MSENLNNIKLTLNQQLVRLKIPPSSEDLDQIIMSPEFCAIYDELINKERGACSQMIVVCLKDISSLLALIFAVREGEFDLHMQAE